VDSIEGARFLEMASFESEIILDLKRVVQEKKKLLAEQTDSLLSSPYIDPDGVVSSFLNKLETSVRLINSQTRFLVALMQATLSGKTRLLLEASIHHPIILISFKTGNTTYWKCLRESIKNQSKNSCDTFEERRFHHHLIILKLKLFLLSFVDFVLFYKKHIIGQNLKWESIDRELKIILFALLANGGGDLVTPFFQQRIEKLNESSLTLISNRYTDPSIRSS
jgi:hypothetical protein